MLLFFPEPKTQKKVSPSHKYIVYLNQRKRLARSQGQASICCSERIIFHGRRSIQRPIWITLYQKVWQGIFFTLCHTIFRLRADYLTSLLCSYMIFYTRFSLQSFTLHIAVVWPRNIDNVGRYNNLVKATGWYSVSIIFVDTRQGVRFSSIKHIRVQENFCETWIWIIFIFC